MINNKQYRAEKKRIEKEAPGDELTLIRDLYDQAHRAKDWHNCELYAELEKHFLRLQDGDKYAGSADLLEYN